MASADTVTLIGVGNDVWNGVRPGPYAATLNGSSINMVCVSFDRHVSVGQTWDVTVNMLTPDGVSNSLYAGQMDALSRYQQAAWLYDQMSVYADQRGDIQGAIWNIFNSGTTPDTAGSNAWLSMAQSQNFAGYDFSRFRILTPFDRTANGPQENITTVPEPATMLLLGTGLAGVAAKLRRRHRVNSGSEKA